MKTRRGIAFALAVALAAVGASALRPHAKSERSAPAAEEASLPSVNHARPAPYAAREFYPSVERAPEDRAPPSRLGDDRLVERGRVDRGPVASAPKVTITRSATAWLGEYQAAVCSCRTRTCVRDLQGSFIEQLSSTEYDQARDGEALTMASRAAMKCYSALPENS
jgi:hypothetical protein